LFQSHESARINFTKFKNILDNPSNIENE